MSAQRSESELAAAEWWLRRRGLPEGPVAVDTGEDEEGSWVITMSDVMSLLLIFFLVWTAAKLTHHPGNYAAAGARASHGVSPVAKPPEAALQGTTLQHLAMARRDADLVIVLQEGPNFAPGQAVLLPRGEELLQEVVPLIKKNLASYDIDVLGHTDNKPIVSGKWASNLDLSMARAEAVWRRLIDLGIPPNRVKIQGLGSLYPAEPNISEISRGDNRRVEIVLRPHRPAA